MFNNIVVATDGSEAAHRAVVVAGDLARSHRAKLTLLHVIEDPLLTPRGLTGAATPAATPLGLGRPAGLTAYREEAHRNADRLLDAEKAQLSGDGIARIETLVEEGDPAERIIETAEREHADAIVLGSRGLGDLKGLLVGSVSHKVASDAKCTCIAVT
jgi:nucleotide-binding universal stress UspA family protein